MSFPDDTSSEHLSRAQDPGIDDPSSSRAAARYLAELDSESVTQRTDMAVTTLGDSDDSATDAVNVGHRLLADTTDDW